jgi:sugar O-acyltransferase (sialic acid O-acetyltransferase NeuD family)
LGKFAPSIQIRIPIVRALDLIVGNMRQHLMPGSGRQFAFVRDQARCYFGPFVRELFQQQRMRVPVVLYGIGSPMVCDVAETCARLGVQIAAWVQNTDGKTWEPAGQEAIRAQDVSAEITTLDFAVPLFAPFHRRAAAEEARRLGFAKPRTLIDPTSIVASSMTFGPGCYVNGGANMGAAGTVGRFVFINRSASVGHHAEIADYVSIGPGAVIAGNVLLGRGAMIAAGAIVLPGMEVGEDAVVAAGAVVTKPVPPRTVVMGNPARVVRPWTPGQQHHPE